LLRRHSRRTSLRSAAHFHLPITPVQPSTHSHTMADGSDSDARTLFFYKLTSTIEADTLQTLTGQFGPIERCHVVTDEITQLPTGSALVTYTQQQDAVAAKSYLHGKWFCGEYLRVAFPGEQPAPVAAARVDDAGHRRHGGAAVHGRCCGTSLCGRSCGCG